MKKLNIVDMTIRECVEKNTFTMNFKEKLEIAKQMDKLKVDIIELPAIVDEKTDLLLIKTIASSVKKSILSCGTGLEKESIDKVYQAVKNAAHPRLHVIVPTSPIQMEYVCGKKSKQVLELVKELVSYSKSLCKDVEFTAVDATRSEDAFLASVIKTAIENGATTITFCDSAGTMLPQEFVEFLENIIKLVPELKNVNISVECRDSLHMANAEIFAASHLINQVKTTITGVNLPSMESVVTTIRQRGDSLDIKSDVKYTELLRTIKQLSWLKKHTGEESEVFAVDETPANMDAELDSNADISKISEIVKKLGYDLSAEDLSKVYEEYERVAAKKIINTKDLEAIIAATALQVPQTYTLSEFVITSGNIISPIANVTLKKKDKKLVGLSNGDGPIEAAFLAIEQIIGYHYELDDFMIQSVTKGSEAVGSAVVKLRYEGKLYSGSGISTDIIGASIRAYISAVNKIVYDNEQQ
ncbi:MAG: hypothetical protein K6G26_01540 [Lachnospiraceae bacterium]|nr:hypothetical protein [Lachnospiraceae bacterium]